MESYDFVIIGAGLAGSYLAGKLANLGSVALIDDGNTTSSSLAQGGIASVDATSSKDSFQKHITDTLTAGAFINDVEIVKFVVENGFAEIENLRLLGVPFCSALHQEGGHSTARIFHHFDKTGEVVMNTLRETLGKVNVLKSTTAVKILVKSSAVEGIVVVCDGVSRVVASPVVVIATGGASGLYKFSSNSHLGSGMYLASKAGATLVGLEFMQFHPTYSGAGLITEAMRGEGAKLMYNGKSIFTGEYNELSPRDVVSREIFFCMQQNKVRAIELDATGIVGIEEKFPTIFASAKQKLGLDISKMPIPISPVAHYSCGGIKVDKNGETNIKNLYALGEASSTGLHGANRLASNSLLECLVFASSIYHHLESKNISRSSEIDEGEYDEDISINEELLGNIREIMWENVGIVRSDDKLKNALAQIESIETEIKEKIKNNFFSKVAIYLAKETCRQSLARTKSIGCYYNVDRL